MKKASDQGWFRDSHRPGMHWLQRDAYKTVGKLQVSGIWVGRFQAIARPHEL